MKGLLLDCMQCHLEKVCSSIALPFTAGRKAENLSLSFSLSHDLAKAEGESCC
jgi:hypothetical protein